MQEDRVDTGQVISALSRISLPVKTWHSKVQLCTQNTLYNNNKAVVINRFTEKDCLLLI